MSNNTQLKRGFGGGWSLGRRHLNAINRLAQRAAANAMGPNGAPNGTKLLASLQKLVNAASHVALPPLPYSGEGTTVSTGISGQIAALNQALSVFIKELTVTTTKNNYAAIKVGHSGIITPEYLNQVAPRNNFINKNMLANARLKKALVEMFLANNKRNTKTLAAVQELVEVVDSLTTWRHAKYKTDIWRSIAFIPNNIKTRLGKAYGNWLQAKLNMREEVATGLAQQAAARQAAQRQAPFAKRTSIRTFEIEEANGKYYKKSNNEKTSNGQNVWYAASFNNATKRWSGNNKQKFTRSSNGKFTPFGEAQT